ncbi:DNA ligase-1 [Polaromonas sp. YR568]|uniref:DNA ligase n=1 Tax=Polaromonas sp. YR568 TaxID=1855301 RepID=UPI0008EB4DE0|nr:DNA ligase [Polaromonas sp. YR568]SFU46558.1 DNA ligase-1 [Polaromonas sp. YR568]
MKNQSQLQASAALIAAPTALFRLTALHLLLAAAGLVTPASPLISAASGAVPAAVLSTPGAPPLMLAKSYHPGISPPDYWVSEKYDGVRGYWDGEKLLTRGGERIAAPAWFTAGWPKVPMDGELWAGRGQFARAVSTVRQQKPDDAAWRGMRYMVFDLPAQSGRFSDRVPALGGVVSRIDQPWVQAVAQSKVPNHPALQALLTRTVKSGGEGLMLHRGASLYKSGRNDDLLKLKTHEDTEARVVGHIPGKGKYAGLVGALLVEMPGQDGKAAQRFKLGTGLSDEQRRNPPPVGSTVTYRFRGLNDSGIPRFASFMRTQEEAAL